MYPKLYVCSLFNNIQFSYVDNLTYLHSQEFQENYFFNNLKKINIKHDIYLNLSIKKPILKIII